MGLYKSPLLDMLHVRNLLNTQVEMYKGAVGEFRGEAHTGNVTV